MRWLCPLLHGEVVAVLIAILYSQFGSFVASFCYESFLHVYIYPLRKRVELVCSINTRCLYVAHSNSAYLSDLKCVL